ncbi:DUF4239 domain-containing protein [Nocardia sp. NPDC088792]|uniref:bestrophin-like domain n=1 Tax=Nocardia sp. NPDC088792 TaxID=3364332 RepID=UPI0037F5B7C2
MTELLRLAIRLASGGEYSVFGCLVTVFAEDGVTMRWIFLLPVLFAVIAVIVFVVGDRVRPKAWRKEEDEEGAHTMVLDLVNMFFAAIVAFVVVICWQSYDDAHSHTVAEAKGLVSVYQAAHDLPEPYRSNIEGLTREYTKEVVTQEWSTMDRHQRLDDKVQGTFDELRAAVDSVPTTDPNVKDTQDKASTALDAASDARYDRGLDAGYRMPTILYVALWFGTVMLLLGTVLAGVVVTKRNLLMTALFGVVVGTVMLSIYQLDRPFSGGNVVPRDAYTLAQQRYDQLGKMPVPDSSASGAPAPNMPVSSGVPNR